MNGLWDILSVAIGVSFIFMILSILNSWIQDNIANLFDIRAKNLADIMQNLLEPNSTKLNGPGRVKAPLENYVEGEPSKGRKISSHVLENEDKLSRIADYFQISAADLRNANLITLNKLPLPDGIELTIQKNSYKVDADKAEGAANNLNDLAKKYGTTPNTLLEENPNVLDGLLLPTGTELKIPETLFMVAGDDDTLGKIADKYGRSIENLLRGNSEIAEKFRLLNGTMLKIPKPYKVQTNDELDDIAARSGITSDELKKANPNISFEEPLPVGTELMIPGTSHKVDEKNDRTLMDVAKNYGISTNALQDENLDVLGRLPLPEKTELTIPETLHEVKGNDNTLVDVEKRYGQDINILRKVNRKILQNLPLLVWTELKIPETLYMTVKDDTLTTIAENHGIPVSALWSENFEILDKLTLPKGTKLKIPDPRDGYMAEAGDTMLKIAARIGVAVDELEKANRQVPFAANDELPKGLTLEIPRLEFGQMASRKNILTQLITNPVGSIYSHPTIYSLSKPGKLPDRIPTNDFTVALLDLLDDVGRGEGDEGKKSADTINIDYIIKGIKNLEGDREGDKITHPLAFRLRSLLYTAQINTQIVKGEKGIEASLDEFQKAVSEWFDNTVARGSLWYKSRMQLIGIVCGFILAISLNADTLGISNALWHNAVLRESISQAADASAKLGQPTGEQAQKQLQELMDIGLPIGWSFEKPDTANNTGNTNNSVTPKDPRAFPTDLGGWVSKIIGLVLTGLAISQGSQIWFDLMNRLLNLRSMGVPSNAEEPKDKEKSK